MLGERLKQLRKHKGLSQTQVSEALGLLDYTRYGKWESGKNRPDVEMLAALADYFCCTTDYLLGRTDDPNVYVKIAHTELGDAIVERKLNKELTPEEIDAVRRLIEQFGQEKKDS